MQVQVHPRGIVNLYTFLCINARATALHMGGKQGFALPVRAPDFKIAPQKLPEGQPPVGITRAKKTYICAVFALFLLTERERRNGCLGLRYHKQEKLAENDLFTSYYRMAPSFRRSSHAIMARLGLFDDPEIGGRQPEDLAFGLGCIEPDER